MKINNKNNSIMENKPKIEELLKLYIKDNADIDNNTEIIIENLKNISGATEAVNKLGSELLHRLNDNLVLETMYNYLAFAQNDLKDYEILFANKSYANAIYHMEQSIEKIAKSFYFLSSPSPNPRKINHKPFKIIIKLLEEYEIFKILEKENKFPLLNMMDSFLGDEDNIIKINNAGLEPIIKIIETLDYFTKRPTNDEKNNYYNMTGLNLALVIPSIYIFSKLLYLHESYTRYPDPNNKLQPNNYNLNLGIVAISPGIAKIIYNTIDIMINIIESSKKYGEL